MPTLIILKVLQHKCFQTGTMEIAKIMLIGTCSLSDFIFPSEVDGTRRRNKAARFVHGKMNEAPLATPLGRRVLFPFMQFVKLHRHIEPVTIHFVIEPIEQELHQFFIFASSFVPFSFPLVHFHSDLVEGIRI